MKTQQIPPDQASWGTFPELAERNQTIMRGILEKAAALQSLTGIEGPKSPIVIYPADGGEQK